MSDLKATSDDVRYAYRLLLGREPDSQGFQHYCDRVEQEKLDPEAIARCLIGSPEFITEHGILTKLKLDAGVCPPSGVVMLCCQACTQAQLETPAFRYWASQLGEVPGLLHRKLWEWCFITQALYERGMLREDRHGLGFAVGNEPLTGLFAKLGCSIVASDVGVEIARREGWVISHQHASDPTQLNRRGLCPPNDFAERVRFREVDMRAVPDDLRGFDFLWSSCALEHLGSLQAGANYVIEAMACLREGGVAVHTTELNCDSDVETIEVGGSVIYRRHDLLALAEMLRNQGHRVEPLDFDLGTSEADKHVEEPPYQGSPQLKLRLGAYTSTSFGLIVQKKS